MINVKFIYLKFVLGPKDSNTQLRLRTRCRKEYLDGWEDNIKTGITETQSEVADFTYPKEEWVQ